MQDKNLIPSTVNAAQIDSTIKYQTNGLLFVTNDTDVVPRNESGAIQIEEGINTPTILVIEPMIKRVTTKSVLKVVNTQFNYYKFPARTILDDEPELDLDLDLSVLQDFDPIYARYTPSEDRKIPIGDTYSGILMDNVEDGLLQRKPNKYYISREIKNSGKDLRFRITLEHRYDSGNTGETSYAYFSLIKTSTSQGIDRAWREYEAPNNGAIKQYEVQRLVIDEIIPNAELQIGDTYSIGAYCTVNETFRYHTITAVSTYWVTTDASKQVDEYNNPTTVIDVPQVTEETNTVTTEVVNTPSISESINISYAPFGFAGEVDGETRTFTAGGLVNEVYEWDSVTDTWNRI